MRIRDRRLLAACVLFLFAVPLAACGSDDDTTTGSGSGSGTTAGGSEAACEEVGDPDADAAEVNVTLQEFTVVPSVDSIATGLVRFVAEDQGSEPHELLVLRTDLAIEDIPTGDDGSIDEASLPDGSEIIGEIAPFPAGETCRGAFDLEPGAYVLLCNIVETEADGAVVAHFAEGMATTVTVG